MISNPSAHQSKVHQLANSKLGTDANIQNSNLKAILSELTRLQSEKKMDAYLYYL
jgi:hypothetical protein